jgi:hypothetical protein
VKFLGVENQDRHGPFAGNGGETAGKPEPCLLPDAGSYVALRLVYCSPAQGFLSAMATKSAVLLLPQSPPVQRVDEVVKSRGSHLLEMIDGGEGGIRTPGPVTVNGFQDRRFKPLSHLSGTWSLQRMTMNRITDQ